MQNLKLLEGAVVDAGEGGFVAQQEGDGGSAVGQAAEDPGETAIVVDGFEFVFEVGLGEHELVIEQVGFEIGDAAEAPAGDGDGVD